MSYSLVGKFLKKDNSVLFRDVNFDILKIINERSYDVALEGIDGFQHSQNEDGTVSVSFNKREFSDALIKVKASQEELKSKLLKLDNIRFSTSYSTMDEVSKEYFESDISSLKEKLEEIDRKMYILTYVIDVFDFIESLYDDKEITLRISAL